SPLAKKKELIPPEPPIPVIAARGLPTDRPHSSSFSPIVENARTVGTYRDDRASAAGDVVAVPASAANRRVTQADLKAAHAEPMVRAAMEIFNGRIVDVQRLAPPAAVEAPSAPSPSTEQDS